MSDGFGAELLSDRTLLGMEVRTAAERIAGRDRFRELSVADRDDLVGTAIDKYYTKWGQHGRPDSLEGWLSTVMHNAMMDQLRARKKVRVARHGVDDSGVGLVERRLPLVPSLSTPVVGQDYVDRFLLAQSPEDARLLRCLGQEYSHREIGEALGISANAVGVRVHRLRARLRATRAFEGGGDH